MAWFDRLKEAAYTPPSGVRIPFFYENVSQELSKKTSAHNFPDADGTLVQDFGVTSLRFPLVVYFWGENHDLDAQAFIGALSERGRGVLEHPMYGAKDVVPFGDITQRDDLKTGANQSVFEVTFYESIGFEYPSTQAAPAQEVVDAIAALNVSTSGQFEAGVDLDSAVSQVAAKSFWSELLGSVKDKFDAIASFVDSVQKQFEAIETSINTAIDILVGQPLALAAQTMLLIQAPARAVALIQDRLEAYGDLLGAILDGDAGNVNDYQFRSLVATAAVSGSVVSVVNNQFNTRTEALEAADTILEQFRDYVEWADANAETLGIIDTGESYQSLLAAVALCAGYLVEISFTLQMERAVVLDRNRTIIDLAYELYGGVDEYLDFLIASNDLSGSEILELPKGRRIVYYV